jgi:5-formyltetrahydrofolate cyclo-ligase
MIKIALTYDFQVLPLLPMEDQDIKIDQIITQDGLIKTIK